MFICYQYKSWSTWVISVLHERVNQRPGVLTSVACQMLTAVVGDYICILPDWMDAWRQTL